MIEELLTGLKQRGVTIPPEVEKATTLTDYATTVRYLGREEPVTRKEYVAAINLAEQVLAWASSVVAEKK